MKKLYNPIWKGQEELGWVTAWKHLGSPWRPSRREVSFFEKTLKSLVRERGEINVLILGATPEYRDMLTKYKNVHVTLLDLNPPMKRAMDQLCRRKNLHEKLVVDNWLKMPLSSNYFDVVMNDEGFENIAVKDHGVLFKNIIRVLKDDGYFFSGRICLDYYFKHPLSLDKIIKTYKKNPRQFQSNHNRLYLLYRLAVGMPGLFNHRRQEVILHRVMKKLLSAAYKVGIENREYLQWTKYVNPFDYCIEVDIKSYKELCKMIKKYFKITKVYQDLFHPVMKLKYNFILRPKK